MDAQLLLQDPTTCPHVNIQIRQWYLSANVFYLREHGLDDMGRQAATPTGMVGVTCLDCDLDADYWPGRVPPWLSARLADLLAELAAEARAEGYW